MANLNNLPIKSISHMARDELVLHILTIRNARRAPTKLAKATNVKTQKNSGPRSTKDILSMLSPEQARMLLSQLGDEDDEEEQ
uniref:Uncharacterized protein n=1 Tax=viral metagenome TaxID=1070528 RepID=A0A6H1ZPG7_9ZZZZ